MWVVGTRHRDSAFFIGNTVVRFVLDLAFGFFLLHVLSKTATLDHETVDYPVKDGAVVETFCYIRLEVFDSFWRFVSE